MVAASAPAYQPAHMFPGLGSTQEIVDLEVTAGMEITLPNCDGTQNMYRGPVRISMPVSPGMPLPIAPPIGYQVYMRLDTDPNTGHMKKVYSVLPGQFQECASKIDNFLSVFSFLSICGSTKKIIFELIFRIPAQFYQYLILDVSFRKKRINLN